MDEGMERKKKQNENKQAEAQKEAFRSVACCGVTDTCDNTVRSGCSSSLIIDARNTTEQTEHGYCSLC